MNFVALRMLMGDRPKYLGIIIGLMFASFLITQQLSIFVGLMARTFSVASDITTTDVWVMDPGVKNIDDTRAMSDNQLFRVRAVPGVAWAVPLFKGQIRARLPNGEGYSCVILGLDDATLTGGPPELLSPDGGKTRLTMDALRQADAVFVDAPNAKEKLGNVQPGDILELNDNRAKVVGLCNVTQSFMGMPVMYTTYSRARGWVPGERKQLSFVLVKTKDGQDPEALCRRINADTGLTALTNLAWKEKTLMYYVRNTGIPVNFGTTVLLGFVVGVAIAGMLFYQFTMDNIRHFGTLKAMGATNQMLIRMILLQTTLAGILGYGMGIGATAVFKIFLSMVVPKSQQIMLMMWQTLAITGAAVFLMIILSALFALIKVIRLEPAIVFK